MAFGVGSRRWLVVLLAAVCGFWQTGDAFSQSKLSPGYAAGDAGLTPSQRAGREIWFFATAFNDRFYTYSYPQRLGAAIDWYLVLAAKNKADLFQAWGGIPDPDLSASACRGIALRSFRIDSTGLRGFRD